MTQNKKQNIKKAKSLKINDKKSVLPGKSETKNKGGRPTKYTSELGERICNAIATSSNGIRVLCKQNEGFPDPDTIFEWIRKNKEFSERYARAKEDQADHLIEEMISISDDGSKDTEVRFTQSGEPYTVEDKEWTSRSKLMVETRKWIASKLKPKKYGDKLDLNHSGEIKTISETTVFSLKEKGK